jgi:hypothetical protein|nr:MAG TPA: hypothetical protein [Caudoviricetes sp.]
MAGIKNINIISGTGNPVQMQDLQNLWSAINSLLRSTKTPISIVAGFATANNDTGTNIGEGIICYQGQAYYLAADVAKIGQYLYANTIQDEQRVYEDGATRYTYQDYVVNAAANASASGIGTLIGQATAANLAAWKVGVLSDGSVTAAMLADGAVTTPKLANSAVTTAKIADGAVGSLQIGLAAIKNGNIQDGQITGSKLADQSIPGSKLNNKTITGTQIADKAITAEKIADATITATQIASETITNEEIANKTIIANQKLENNSIEEAQYGTASVSTRALQTNSVTTSIIKDGAITPKKLADKISVLLPNTVTSITHNISTSPIDFPEGTIGTLNIPPSPSNHAITVYLVQSSSGLLVHHWTMLVFKNDVGPFQITFSGGSIGTMPFDLPQYAITCILDIYFYAPYGLIVGVAQPNFIVK